MQTYNLTVRRVINAPVEKVFAAWTDQNMAKQWLSPESHTVLDAKIETKVGGAYRIVMSDDKGQKPTTNGVVKELVPNKKLVFTWQWEGQEMAGDGETLVSLDFKPMGEDKTELILTHTEFKSEKSKENHNHGWESCFNRLEKALAN